MRSSNPALGDSTFQVRTTSDPMTIEGTVNKSFMLIAMVMIAAYYSWNKAFPYGWSENAEVVIPNWYFPAIIGAFIISLVIIFKKTTAPYLAPVYAILEGLALGAISALFESRYPGIVVQAIFGTFGTFLALLLAYRSGLIKATENFKLGVMAATGGIAIMYLISMVMGFFGKTMPFLHDATPLGIGISVVIVIVAALNLVLDFDFIENGVKQGAPKYMEWYASFGLLVTLVWLYLEILRLLSKTRRN